MKAINTRYLLLLVALCLPALLQAQNLVPNGGFENIIASPGSQAQLNLAQPWQSLNATPDLYYKGQTIPPVTNCDYVDVPVNVGGYTPERNGKNGYAGIKIDLNANYREYISAPLAIPLQKDTLYRVEFFVMRADSSRYACNRIAALFTNNIPIQPGTAAINFAPKIEAINIISDTANWTLVTGIYQATGGENYITIGVFRTDTDPLLQKTDFAAHNSGCANFDNSAYYYIDDVLIRPVTEVVQILGDTIICPGESTVLSANASVPIWWSDSNNPTDTLSKANSITINPSVQTTYYLNGLFVRDSVKVYIVSPPSVALGADSLLCEGDTVELDAFIIDGINYTWSTGDTLPFINVTELGDYWVIVENAGCSNTDTISFYNYLPNPPIDLGIDSLYCFFRNDTLRLDGGDAVSWSWIPSGDTTRQITVLNSAVYTVTAIRENGCPRTASIGALEVCTPDAFIPTGFTPDGDGLNDVFRPQVNNVFKFNLRILNRGGQTIFYTEDPNIGWNGTYEGKESPVGVYVYRLNYEGLDDEGDKLRIKKLGTITLIR